MARITVEDCLKQVPNRFELTVLAAKRARHLLMTAEEPMVPWENDKATVVALREIAAGYVTQEFIALQEASRAEAESFLSPDEMLAQAAASMAELSEEMELVVEESEIVAAPMIEFDVDSLESDSTDADSTDEEEDQ